MKMTFELSLVTSDTEDTYFKEKNNPVLNNFNYFFSFLYFVSIFIIGKFQESMR